MRHLEPLETRCLFADLFAATAAEFQARLNSASLGDNIILTSAQPYIGQFTLPNKTAGTGWITIKGPKLNLLPGEGVRVSPADAANMPRLQSQGGNASVVRTSASAHHYKFVGIEFVGPAPTTNVPRPELVQLIELGTDASSQNTVASVPHDLILDRCYMHPYAPDLHIRRAVALNSGYTDITNSYIEEIHQPGSDSQAIGGWNGTGYYNIINNHLEGASENIMFGGATGRIPNVVPSHIVIRGNHVIKPLHWQGLRDPVSNLTYNIKNLFELKVGSDVLVEGNIFENNWVNGQSGVPIVLKLGNLEQSPWNVTEDVVFQNNIVKNAIGAVTLQGRDYAAKNPDGSDKDPGGLVRRLTFKNNVFEQVDGVFLYMTHGPKQVTFDHNTSFATKQIVEVDTVQWEATDFKFTNNLVAHNNYGVRSTDGTGNVVFNKYFDDPGHVFAKNVIVGVPWVYRNSYTARPDNFLHVLASGVPASPPTQWDPVKFVDRANGDYHLAADSPYKNAGSDGKDIGADIDTLNVALNGAIGGLWQQALQTIVVNNGETQRSRVNTVALTFNQPITSTAGALSLTRRTSTGVTVVATPSADKKTYTLTFTGAGIESGSLADGVYDFLADVSEFKDAFGYMPVGTRIDQNRSLVFHRLFGDSDGDKDVDGVDSLRFRQAQGSTSAMSAYRWFFDFDNDGDIDGVDSLRFKQRQGLIYTY